MTEWDRRLSDIVDIDRGCDFKEIEESARQLLKRHHSRERAYAVAERLLRCAVRLGETEDVLERLFREAISFTERHPYDISNNYIAYGRALWERGHSSAALQVVSDGIGMFRQIGTPEAMREKQELESLVAEFRSTSQHR